MIPAGFMLTSIVMKAKYLMSTLPIEASTGLNFPPMKNWEDTIELDETIISLDTKALPVAVSILIEVKYGTLNSDTDLERPKAARQGPAVPANTWNKVYTETM